MLILSKKKTENRVKFGQEVWGSADIKKRAVKLLAN